MLICVWTGWDMKPRFEFLFYETSSYHIIHITQNNAFAYYISIFKISIHVVYMPLAIIINSDRLMNEK